MITTKKEIRSGETLPDWEGLIDTYGDLLADRSAKKEQGLNDFNLLGSVLSANDEVRLHTRFLYALLNPNGKHYRGARFLELFLNYIGRPRWLDLDSESLVVRKEYRPSGQGEQVDLYISDGTRIILIENKLNALDQPGQVKRYLKAVGADSGERSEDTLFIYLSKGRDRPSRNALAYPEVQKKNIPPDPEPLHLFAEKYLGTGEGTPWALYQNLSYRSQPEGRSIHAWLEACIDEIRDLEDAENMVGAIEDYRNVVRHATREYVSNVESLKEHLEKRGDDGFAFHEKAIELAEELRKAHFEWLHDAMTVKVPDLFRSAVNDGLLMQVGQKNAEELIPYLDNGNKAKAEKFVYDRNSNFFSKSGDSNRGVFFIVKGGLFKDEALIMLFYGKTFLHVGCVFRNDNNVNDQVEPLSDLSKDTKLRKAIFPGAMTKYQRLEKDGIMSLARFETSTVKEDLKGLATAFGIDMDQEGEAQ